jgi:hypothetical protein
MSDHRDIAVGMIRTLREAGHEALLAGGCVRDELLGLHPKDYDVATDAPPEKVEQLFQSTRAVGRAFGVMQVRRNGVSVEVATFRTESGYSDNRRPDSVEFCDAQADAQRRDFTINALFIDPLDTGEQGAGRIIDYVGGRGDIEARTIRAVGDADARLSEDDLRALRAVRFSARLGFEIHEETRAAITRHAGGLDGISRERIGDELRRMFLHRSRGVAVSLLHALGLDGPVLGGVALPGCEAAIVLGLEETVPFEVALAGWACDRSAEISPGLSPAQWVGGVGVRYRQALCLSNDETERFRLALCALETLSGERVAFASLGVAEQKRLFASRASRDARMILAVQRPDKEAAIGALYARLEGSPSGIAPEAFMDGSDLIGMGFRPGPVFKGVLDAVYDAQLEDRIGSKKEALTLARSLGEKDRQ